MAGVIGLADYARRQFDNLGFNLEIGKMARWLTLILDILAIMAYIALAFFLGYLFGVMF